MARNLVINGVTYNGVESLKMTDENGEQVLFTEGGAGGEPEDLTSVLDTQEAKLNELLTILDGKAVGGGSDMITFTVVYPATGEQAECQAPAGMTFDEWLNSEYDPFGITSYKTLYYNGHVDAGQSSAVVWETEYIIMPCAKYVII